MNNSPDPVNGFSLHERFWDLVVKKYEKPGDCSVIRKGSRKRRSKNQDTETGEK